MAFCGLFCCFLILNGHTSPPRLILSVFRRFTRFKVSLNYKRQYVHTHTHTRREGEHTPMNYLPNVNKLMILPPQCGANVNVKIGIELYKHHLHLIFIVFTSEKMPPQLSSQIHGFRQLILRTHLPSPSTSTALENKF